LHVLIGKGDGDLGSANLQERILWRALVCPCGLEEKQDHCQEEDRFPSGGHAQDWKR
jgi:hypothetical protein